MARPVGAPGAAGDLMEQLIGPLAGPQIAAGHAEIGIDDPDQRQQRKMVALGDDLRADQHVVAMRRDRLDQLGSGARPGQQVADHQRDPGSGEACLGLLPDPLDPGTARHEAAGSRGIPGRAPAPSRRGRNDGIAAAR